MRFNRRRNIPNTPITSVPAGYRYMRHCRCGHGPNAYYQTTRSSIVPVHQIFTGAIPQQQSTPTVPVSSSDQEKILKERLEQLQEEIADVTNQLEELEDKKKRFPFRWRRK
jgi:hypothetical protein